MSHAPTPRQFASSGLQDRTWEASRLTWAERLLWLWFLVYAVGLVVIARRVRVAVGGWLGVATMLGCMALGLLVWRRSLAARIKRLSTIVGHWGLVFGYWVLFAPWAFLMQRRNPLQLRTHANSSWTNRTQHLTTLRDAARQY